MSDKELATSKDFSLDKPTTTSQHSEVASIASTTRRGRDGAITPERRMKMDRVPTSHSLHHSVDLERVRSKTEQDQNNDGVNYIDWEENDIENPKNV